MIKKAAILPVGLVALLVVLALGRLRHEDQEFKPSCLRIA